MINGMRVNTNHWPLNTDIEIRIRGQVVNIRKSDAQSIEVRGQAIEIRTVPFSSICNISSVSGASVVGHHGDLVVGAGQSMTVSASLFGSQRTTELKQGQGTTHTTIFSPLSWLLGQRAAEPQQEAPETTDEECHACSSFNASDCAVCLEASADGAFLPCGHKCCCLKCGESLDKCPICRAEGFVVHISYVSKSQRIFV